MWPRAVRNMNARPGRALCALAAPGHGQRHLKVRGTSKDLERWTGGARRQPGPGPRGTWLGLWTLFTCLLFRFTRIGLQSVQLPTLRAPSKPGGNQPARLILASEPDQRRDRQTEPGRHPPSPAFCITAVRGSRPSPTPRQPSACSGDRGKQSPQSMEADDPSTWHCPEPPLNATRPRGAGRLPVPADGDGDR